MTHTLALEIDYAHVRAGWINCFLIVDGERHHIDASYACPPFTSLLYFVRAVAGQRLPAKFFWDEEGRGVNFLASTVDDDGSLVHLKIKHLDAELPWLDDVVEHQAVIQAFLPPLMDLSQHFLRAEVEWRLSRRSVAEINSQIGKGFPLRTDIQSPQQVAFTVTGTYDIEYIGGQVFLEIRPGFQETISLQSQDTSPFWSELIIFFGNIASGNLPAECEHVKDMDISWDGPADIHLHLVKHFRAEPLDDPQNFRLKIFTSDHEEKDFLFLEEVVNRREFVRTFADSIKGFLQDKYQVRPDDHGNTFDLRTLSLDKLA